MDGGGGGKIKGNTTLTIPKSYNELATLISVTGACAACCLPPAACCVLGACAVCALQCIACVCVLPADTRALLCCLLTLAACLALAGAAARCVGCVGLPPSCHPRLPCWLLGLPPLHSLLLLLLPLSHTGLQGRTRSATCSAAAPTGSLATQPSSSCSAFTSWEPLGQVGVGCLSVGCSAGVVVECQCSCWLLHHCCRI